MSNDKNKQDTKSKKGSPNEKPISLHPLTLEDAVVALLETPPKDENKTSKADK